MTEFDHSESEMMRRLENARVPEGTRVYAIGDIHGCVEHLYTLHWTILQDVKRAECERRVVVYVGDYIDRGPNPRETVDLLIEEPLPDSKRFT